MTRKQIRYFGTKRQRAALKGRKKGRKAKRRISGTSALRKSADRSRTSTVTISKPRTKKRRASGIRGMKVSKDKIMSGVINGGAAFGGGYLSGMMEEKLPIDDPMMRTGATAAVGLLMAVMDPRGPIGAAGCGVLGGAGRGMHDAPPEGGGGAATVTGRRRRNPDRLKRFRDAMQNRGVNGGTKYRTMTGMPDDRSVITGPGNPGANYPANTMRNRF